MSIKFTSNNPDITDVLIIGGNSDSIDSPDLFDTNDKGGYGPFPSYSISKEILRAGDGTYLSSKYTINISGKAVVKPGDRKSALVQGGRQSSVFGEKIVKLQTNRSKFPMIGVGTLEIIPYGTATTSLLTFYDARMVSVEIPEQQDDSPDLHYTDYNFTFEAYQKKDESQDSTALVSSVEESWDFAPEEGKVCFKDGDISQIPFKVYKLTHTLSATGIRKYSTAIPAVQDSDGEPWRQAAKWIKSRVRYEPQADILSHVNNASKDPSFNPFYMNHNSSEIKNQLKVNLRDPVAEDDGRVVEYFAYNYERTSSNVTLSGGGYQITDTWICALKDTKALHTLSTSVDNQSSSGYISVTVNGTVEGLSDLRPADDTETYKINKNEKYHNANSELIKVLGFSYTEAQRAYNEINFLMKPVNIISNTEIEKTLSDVKHKKSVARNQNTGTINWSITYHDTQIIGDSDVIASEDINIQYNNHTASDVVAIIPVIGKNNGPVVQYWGDKTIDVKNTNISITLVFKTSHRPELPPTSYAEDVLDKYFKSPDYDSKEWNISSRNETWNPDTGNYSLKLDIVGDLKTPTDNTNRVTPKALANITPEDLRDGEADGRAD